MAAETTGFQAPGSWSFDGITHETKAQSTYQRHAGPGAPASESNDSSDSPPRNSNDTHQREREQDQRSWQPRTCRICLETVHPTFPTVPDHMPSMLQGRPTPIYVSEDCGRLIRPCKCKGSQRYVHEGCLQEWRYADPMNKRNYWNCPTCGFQYRLTRMTWARWLTSSFMQVGLTSIVFITAIFILGFVADPIINIYLDPVGSIAGGTVSTIYMRDGDIVEDYADEKWEEGTWSEHFMKGFGALGIVGFLKAFLAAGPLQWFNFRGNFINIGGGRRAGNTGRDRVSNIPWAVLLLGAITFLYTVWTVVRSISKRLLEKASESVLDVPLGPGESGDDD